MTPENRKLAFEFARKEAPREACGLLIIEKGKEVFIPCRNVSPVDHQFEIAAEDWAKAEDRGDVVRVIHSHCYIPAIASHADRVSCEATGIPWSIVSVPNGTWFDFEPSNFRAPLVGREWAHGVLDCYSIIRDYYQEILGLTLPDFERSFEWWKSGQNLYAENFKSAGFLEVKDQSLEKHDVILMQISSDVENHGAVYLGDEMILHHLQYRLSSRDVYGGYFQKHTTRVLRYARD